MDIQSMRKLGIRLSYRASGVTPPPGHRATRPPDLQPVERAPHASAALVEELPLHPPPSYVRPIDGSLSITHLDDGGRWNQVNIVHLVTAGGIVVPDVCVVVFFALLAQRGGEAAGLQDTGGMLYAIVGVLTGSVAIQN